jgi:molecular chaperone GrpE
MKKNKQDNTDPQENTDDVIADVVPEVELTPEEALVAERDDLLDRLQRVSAEFMNYQKRTQREREEQAAFAKADIVRAMLAVLDDMERALAAAGENHGEDDPFYQGIEMVHKHMLDVLARFGCQPIDAVGQPFDPEQHSALMQQPTDEYEANTVIQDVQRGYSLHGKTLRPAGVVVAVAPVEETPDDSSEDDSEE